MSRLTASYTSVFKAHIVGELAADAVPPPPLLPAGDVSGLKQGGAD